MYRLNWIHPVSRSTKVCVSERMTYALALLATMKISSIRKSCSFICPRIVDGSHTPDAVSAAPKVVPAMVCVTRLSGAMVSKRGA